MSNELERSAFDELAWALKDFQKVVAEALFIPQILDALVTFIEWVEQRWPNDYTHKTN